MIQHEPMTLAGWRAEELVDGALALGGAEALGLSLQLMDPDEDPLVRQLLPAAAVGARAGLAEVRAAGRDDRAGDGAGQQSEETPDGVA